MSMVGFLTGPDWSSSMVLRPWSGPSSNKNGGLALASTTALACGSRSTGLAMTASSGRRCRIERGRPAHLRAAKDKYRQGLGLGTWELGGDALGLLQNRVEVLCLD